MTQAKKALLQRSPCEPQLHTPERSQAQERHKHHCGMQMPFLISQQFASHGFPRQPRRLGTNEPIPEPVPMPCHSERSSIRQAEAGSGRGWFGSADSSSIF